MTSLSQTISQLLSISSEEYLASLCTPAAETEKLKSVCPSLYGLIQIPIWSVLVFSRSSRMLNCFKMLSGEGSYILIIKYTDLLSYTALHSVRNSSGIGFPLSGSIQTKFVPSALFFQQSSSIFPSMIGAFCVLSM